MGKIITKLYEYDSSQESNEYRGTDYSQYILLGDSDCDNLDDTLDTVELTLAGLPFREEFAPSTKFIYEKWQELVGEDGLPTLERYKNLHLVVSTDAVEQPIMSDDTYFNHSITFIEASVEAQKRLVDNIAVTYRLKNVSLKSTPLYDVNANAISTKTDVEPQSKYGVSEGFIWETRTIGHSFVWEMPNWYQVTLNGVTKTPSWSDWRDFKLYQEIPSNQTSTTIELPVPMLRCRCGINGGSAFAQNGYCSIDVIVERTPIAGGQTTVVQQFRVDPAEDTPEENTWNRDEIGGGETRRFGEIVSRYVAQPTSTIRFLTYISKVSELTPTKTNRVISLTIDVGFQYRIICKRHVFKREDYAIYNGVAYDDYPAYICRSKSVQRFAIVSWTDVENTAYYVNDNYPETTISFNAVLEGTNQELFLREAPIASAYDLYNKAQLCTQNFRKVSGTPVDETQTSFYLEKQDKQELKNTIIVENFYNQKNLWEIQMDIGKYIHARPQIRFGSNNRFKTTWKKYGLTDQYEDRAKPISIYNSRFIEEYISACSSYVTNMVQLDGIITETVAPKSSSEDYLVYNDVAEIIVEKPIIEIVKLEIIKKSNNMVKDITNYVFEESVYNLLSINANDSVNKGLAIYYKLGTNKIVGLNYQLPSINTGAADTEYAIKRIIGKEFGLLSTSDIQSTKINDYLFRITYRTKDTLRSNQSRPDLRKYLLSTPFDRVPQHNQFNNQQDVVVDSVKFGNNIYGKLIRTGNTVYTKLEWVDGLPELKHSGELYTIDNNLYYVSKVKNTYYEDHIESEVEFSKDFNRLSQIIGIPSEPRFYEISERSSIDREISLDDYIVLGTSSSIFDISRREDSCVSPNGWNYIKDLLLGEEKAFPKYAVTVFKNDIDKLTIAGNETFKVETCHPVCAYSIENTLTLEWDMRDNFSAGDQVGETSQSKDPNKPDDTAYYTLKPFRYGDVYGRCDMIDFAIVSDYTFANQSEVLNLPANPIPLNLSTNEDILFTSAKYTNEYGSQTHGIITLKDNRETLKFNYNLQVLTDSDRFVLSAYMWKPGKQNLKLGLLNTEINKISNATISNMDFAITEIPFSATVDPGLPILDQTSRIVISINTALTNYATSQNITLDELMEGIKAIVIYSTNEVNENSNSGAKYFVFGKNIGGLSVADATKNWTLRHKRRDDFKSQ